MQLETTIDPKAIYEGELKRLQGELGTMNEEIRKQKIVRGDIATECKKLTDSIQTLRDEIAKLEQDKKDSEEAFKQSRANSIKALDKRDQDTQDREEKARERDKVSLELQRQANSAKSQLIAISEDLTNTIKTIEGKIKETLDPIKEELKSYLALKEDPKAPIPSPEE